MEHETGSVNLTGKVALVTSIATFAGFEIAKMLVMAGAVVHVVDPDHERNRAQLGELRKLGKAIGHVVDLQDAYTVAHFGHLLFEQLPELHILVCNERIASSTTSSAVFAESILEQYGLFGDLCLVHDLLDCLSAASTVAEPARVVVVGDFTGLGEAGNEQQPAAKKLPTLSHAKGIAQRFVANRVNVNFIDLGHDGGADPSESKDLLRQLRFFLSAAAVQTRGEVAQFVSPVVNEGDVFR